MLVGYHWLGRGLHRLLKFNVEAKDATFTLSNIPKNKPGSKHEAYPISTSFGSEPSRHTHFLNCLVPTGLLTNELLYSSKVGSRSRECVKQPNIQAK